MGKMKTSIMVVEMSRTFTKSLPKLSGQLQNPSPIAVPKPANRMAIARTPTMSPTRKASQ